LLPLVPFISEGLSLEFEACFACPSTKTKLRPINSESNLTFGYVFLHMSGHVIEKSTGKQSYKQLLKSPITVPVKLKLQHFPRAYPGHLTVHRARGGRNFNVVLEGWGI